MAVPAVEALPERAFVPSCSTPGPALSPTPAPTQINLVTVDELRHTEVEYPGHIYWLNTAGPAVTGTPGASKDVLPRTASRPLGDLPRRIDMILWLPPYARTVPMADISRHHRLQASGKARGPQRPAASYPLARERRSAHRPQAGSAWMLVGLPTAANAPSYNKSRRTDVLSFVQRATCGKVWTRDNACPLGWTIVRCPARVRVSTTCPVTSAAWSPTGFAPHDSGQAVSAYCSVAASTTCAALSAAPPPPTGQQPSLLLVAEYHWYGQPKKLENDRSGRVTPISAQAATARGTVTAATAGCWWSIWSAAVG